MTHDTRVNLDAPLPLGYMAALTRAWELRSITVHTDAGKDIQMTWTTIAFIMREYHGFPRTPSWWRDELRRRGLSKPDLRRAENFNKRNEPRGLQGYLAGHWNGPA